MKYNLGIEFHTIAKIINKHKFLSLGQGMSFNSDATINRTITRLSSFPTLFDRTSDRPAIS